MRFLPLLLLLFALSACRKEVDENSVPDSGVYIVNEGNFNFGNGDVSVYDPELQTISNGLLKMFQSTPVISDGRIPLPASLKFIAFEVSIHARHF